MRFRNRTRVVFGFAYSSISEACVGRIGLKLKSSNVNQPVVRVMRSAGEMMEPGTCSRRGFNSARHEVIFRQLESLLVVSSPK